MTRPRTREVAGGVVVDKNGSVIVVNQNGDSWSFPKGGIDEGEDALSAARREIAEESGITKLQFIKPLPSYQRFSLGKGGMDEDRTVLNTFHMFLFRTDETRLLPRDPENPEARWVAKDDVAKLLTHPKDREYFYSVLFEL